MRLLRHNVSGAQEPRRLARGAWYPDPFGVGDERWWDGGRWTDEVRSSAEAEAAARPPDRTARTSGFPVTIDTVVGEQLSVVPSLRKPGIHCQVLAVGGRVASISVFGRQTARLACAHGAWLLKKSGSDARGFRIESVDHEQAGTYLRRGWSPGGTIRLAEGTEVELRRSLPGRWKLRSADDSRCLAEVHRPVLRSAQPQELKLTIHSLPGDAEHASVLILAACALVMLSADTG